MPLMQSGDYVQLTTYDGMSITIPDGVYTVGVLGGAGAPPTTFVTKQGYRQDGETSLGQYLGKRQLTLQLHRNPACSRADYWTHRTELHEILRLNRGGQITLTVVQSGGTVKRAIVVRADPGAVFAEDPSREAGWYIDEKIGFVAFSPVWFDPTGITINLQALAQQNLVFPITFPIIWGTPGLAFSTTITYAGNYPAHPIFTLTGPYNAAIIQNATTGISFSLTTPITSGAVRIINLTPGAISITDPMGVSHFGDLGPNCDLVDFTLVAPGKAFPNGTQTINITLLNTAVGSGASIFYQNQYIAI
jgi:hypothetical protein